MPQRCEHLKEDGTRCKAAALHGERSCFFHSPRTEGQRTAARKRGGRERAKVRAVLPADTPDAPTETPQQLDALLGRTANQVLRGEVDPRIANAVAYIVSVQLRAKEVGDLEERLRTLELLQKGKRP